MHTSRGDWDYILKIVSNFYRISKHLEIYVANTVHTIGRFGNVEIGPYVHRKASKLDVSLQEMVHVFIYGKTKEPV